MANKKTSESHIKGFPIVVIGASAGGFRAVQQLFEQLSPDTGMAYLYMQISGHGVEGLMASSFDGVSKMTVKEAGDQMQLEPDHIYIIPPDKDTKVSHGVLHIGERKHRPRLQSSLDVLFNSVAEHHRDGAIGILLSGKGHDGSAGLKAIKIAGGITFCQDETAEFDEMPKAAMAEGVVDLVLPPAEIAKELERLGRQSGMFAAMRITGNGRNEQDDDFLNIIQLLRKVTGIDFSHYKVSTIKRRIIRRMMLYKLDNLGKYYDYLRRHTNEITSLYQDLLINVTCFFRDGDSMEYLRKTVLPQIMRGKGPEEPLRIWVPACSTGEEAYSLAMLLVELQEDNGSKGTIQIFGTDLSELAISKARLGVYNVSDLAEVSDSRLSKFFVRVDADTYRVNKTIRDICIFAQHNVFKDPPFSRLDLISCCNLFIYLDNVLQQKCIGLFYYALNPHGYLVLGKSEAVNSPGQQMFAQLEKKFKVYVKKLNTAVKLPSQGITRVFAVEKKIPAGRKKNISDVQEDIPNLEKMVDDILYARFIPASVVINQQMEILQFRGSTNLFLEPSRGKASFNLMKMARPGLIFDLRNCIHKAITSRAAVKKKDIELMVKENRHLVSIEIIPLQTNDDDKLLLIIFEEHQDARSKKDIELSKDEVVQKLHDELNTVRNDMRSIIEEQEANKEELQSANEEIISSNEELQSINEELETSKEEVESANEKLTSINAELQRSNEQLMETQEYADAMFQTIQEGVVVLNADLRVKMANASFYRTFHARADAIEGRSLFEIADGRLDTAELRTAVDNILFQGMQIEGNEMQFPLLTTGTRVMLLNGRRLLQKAGRQELLLLAFDDITDRRRAEKMTAEREEWFRNMANNAPVMIWTAGPDGLRTFFNVTWLTYTGRSMDEEIANGWVNDVYPPDKDQFLSIYKKGFQEQKEFMIEYRLRRWDGEYRWVRAIGRPTFSPDDQFTGFVGICTEIHDSKLMQEELERKVNERTHDLQEVNKELQRSNSELQQFAYVASHDLQEPLRKILTFSDRLLTFTGLPASTKSYLEKISTSAARMSQLIHDLLEFSRAIRISGQFVAVDLNATLRSALSTLDMTIKQKQAIIVPDELPVIEAIPLQMEQLFYNIVSNAIKFSKEQAPPVVRISSLPVKAEVKKTMEGLNPALQYIEIIFEDNGIGFSNEYAEQIFVIFQRLNAKHEYPGTGIGLALCRKIVENHGGKIFATSIEQVRTEFHVILPTKHVKE
jgi:two-component system CheB/CheR fusion protein